MKKPTQPSGAVPPSRDLGYSLPRQGPGAKKEKQRQRDWKHAPAAEKKPYIELRAASAFSFLEGASPPEDLVDAAAANGIEAMALVDTNGVYGAPRFYGAAKKAGLRAIVGAEVVIENVDFGMRNAEPNAGRGTRNAKREIEKTVEIDYDPFSIPQSAIRTPHSDSIPHSAFRNPQSAFTSSRS